MSSLYVVSIIKSALIFTYLSIEKAVLIVISNTKLMGPLLIISRDMILIVHVNDVMVDYNARYLPGTLRLIRVKAKLMNLDVDITSKC